MIYLDVMTRGAREPGAYPPDPRSSGVGWNYELRKRFPGIGRCLSLVRYAPALARIHAERCPGVSARIPGTSVDYGDARQYDEPVVTRGYAGY